MGKSKNKNRQIIIVSILVIALVSLFVITQFDPTGKFDAADKLKFDKVAEGSSKDKISLLNRPPVITFDPEDLSKYQIPNVEADADYSFEWPIEDYSLTLSFSVSDPEGDQLKLPEITAAQGISPNPAMSSPHDYQLVFSEHYIYPITISVTEKEFSDSDRDGIPDDYDPDYGSNNQNSQQQNQQNQQGQNTQVSGTQQNTQQYQYQGGAIISVTGDAGSDFVLDQKILDSFKAKTTTIKIYVYPSEAEIEPIINIYLKDNPELELNSIPVGEKVIIDASKSTLNDEIPASDTILTAEWTTPGFTQELSEPLKKEGHYSVLGTKNISLTLKLKNFPDVVSETVTKQININNGVYSVLSNPKDGDKINIDELIQFVDESYSITEPIISSIIDFDDEEQAWGAFSVSAPITEVPTCFSKIGTNEFCIGDNILTLDNQIYDGVPCGCKNYYMSFPTKKKDITGFVGGTTAHKYESVDACGDDKLCNVELTIKTENYESSTQINLIFDKQAICEDDPENDICKIQTITDICDRFPDYFAQCNLDAPVGNLTNDTTNLDALSTDVAAQDNFVAQNTPSKDQYDDPLDNIKEKEEKPSQKYNNYDYGGNDKNEEGSSGSGGMMLIVILLITLLGGVGFFLWRRNKASGTSAPKAESEPAISTEESPAEPDQNSNL